MAVRKRRVERRGAGLDLLVEQDQPQPVLLTVNEWYKAQHLGTTYWLYVVWDPLTESPETVKILNPAARLDHAKREIAGARHDEVPANAIREVTK